jgi:DNA-binding NarL/FixJ family response regulator
MGSMSHQAVGAHAPIRVFVIEDSTSVREALALLLDGSPGFAVAGTAGNAESALAANPLVPPDVVLVDIGLPGISGIDALPGLRDHWPHAELLMLTIHDDGPRIFSALCAGAMGYLLKTTPPATLLEAIREARDGGAPMSASVARQVVQVFRRPDPAAGMLSPRERDVLKELIDGKTYRQIGDTLYISVNTVAFHVKQIYQKLHVHSRAEVAARAGHRGP